ncbi:MAG: phosphate ABC transporter substrate-binding protein PstS [Gemmatimonadota bacterium]
MPSPRVSRALMISCLLAGCGGSKSPRAAGSDSAATSPTSSATLTGAGASFPNPVYTKWFDAYARKTGVHINYQSVGSGAGIRQFTEGTVDFGATDGPMNDEQITSVQGNVVHIPTVMGAVVVTYNLPGLGSTPLKFDGPTLVDIFEGKVKKWNDRRMAALNPAVNLPASDIIVVHRSDGSGTTFIWTDYLSKVSAQWKSQVGAATSVNWPIGLGGKGNEGVTQQVKQVEGAIGYVELIYALSNNLPVAQVRNASGAFITPTLESTTAAADGLNLGAETDFRVSITNAPGAAAYPIASFTWLLVPRTSREPAKGKVLADFLGWMISEEAQGMAGELHYAPLPAAIRDLVRTRIASLGAAAPAT